MPEAEKTEAEKPDIRIWGYSKEEPAGRIFDDGKLPAGYYDNPAKVPGSEAEARFKADSERDGVGAAPAPQPDPQPQPVPQPEPQPDPAAAGGKPTLKLPNK